MKNIKLRIAREASGKTQARVAKEAGINLQQYQHYEYGERIPRVDIANRIARAVNSTAENLWGYGAATPDNTKEPDGNQA